MAPQAAALADSRSVQRRAGRPVDAARPESSTTRAVASDLRGALPTEVADRLAGLMASDPALASAVSAQLPAARLRSASDLAAYAPNAAAGHTLDVSG